MKSATAERRPRSGLADRVDGALAGITGRADSWRDRQPRGTWRGRAAAGAALVSRGFWHVWRNRRYFTVLKLANMAAVNVQMRLRTERVLGRPYRLKIESTNVCNTRCQLCPTGVGLRGRERGVMPLERYRELIDRWRRFLYVLDLSMWGDPLIAPEIYEMVSYAHQRGVWTYLSTNLHGFRPERGDADRLVASGLDMITVSLHGASQETFAAYQPGKDFAATLQKLRALVAARERGGGRRPAIQLNFVVTRKNEHEREAFRRLAADLGCAPLFSAPSLNLRFLDRDRNLQPLGLEPAAVAARAAATMEEWLPSDQDFVVEPYRRMRAGTYRAEEFNGHKVVDCDWPWRSGVVNWDGSLVACCGVFASNDDFGNVFEQPLGALWNGRAYRMARRSFKRPAPAPAGYANPCRECPGFLV